MPKQKLVIEPHFRLQEWVAEEKGYFKDEGLDYEFRELIRSSDGKHHDKGGKTAGAYQSFEQGRGADVSCACHWTVNVAASSGHGKLYADVYSVAPAGIFVPQSSPVTYGILTLCCLLFGISLLSTMRLSGFAAPRGGLGALFGLGGINGEILARMGASLPLAYDLQLTPYNAENTSAVPPAAEPGAAPDPAT